MTQAIDQLKRHVQDEINSIQSHTAQATQDLDQLMHAERGQLDKLRNLDELSNLQQLVFSVNSMKQSYDESNSKISTQIDKLSQAINNMKSNNTISASIGLPPIVLWILSGLVGIAAVLFIYHSLWIVSGSDDSQQVQPSEEIYQEIDSVAVDTVASEFISPIKKNG